MALKDCFDNFITIEGIGVTPVSGLYLNRLHGATVKQFASLQKRQDEEEFVDAWNNFYALGKENFLRDVTGRLNGKFFVDKIHFAAETSKFKSSNNTGSGLAGVKITQDLSPYSEVEILRVQVESTQAYASPASNIVIKDTDEDGETLSTVTLSSVDEGVNTFNVYEKFAKRKLFVGFDRDNFLFKETQDKVYTAIPQTTGLLYDQSSHINGGGVNIEYNVGCSVERFICSRLNLFKRAFWYRLGVDLALERLTSDRVNKWTIMTEERADKLLGLFEKEYEKELDAIFKDFRADDDPYCLECKSVVYSKTMLP